MRHLLEFDPRAAYPIEALLSVETPLAPADFDRFWGDAYKAARQINPLAQINDTGREHKHWKIYDIRFQSTGDVTIGGWLLVPVEGEPSRAFVVGHGYGGRDGPDLHLPFADALLFFPCCRGISRSATPPFSQDPYWHVIHDIDKKDRYILRGCVEDIWLSVSVLEHHFPSVQGRIGYLGVSFSGGVGALALAQEERIARAHFNVPTFGNHRLRLRIATQGSGKSIQDFFKKKPRTLLRTLRYYDAANAAERIKAPVNFALALRDSVVAPPGQFAIYNQASCEKHLFVLEAGHDQYPNQAKQEAALMAELVDFFSHL